jgi:hypothetical protein
MEGLERVGLERDDLKGKFFVFYPNLRNIKSTVPPALASLNYKRS